MCGIAGFIGTSILPEQRIRATLELMTNRGPDHQEWTELRDRDHNVYLLHSRLNIIDLHERANQPFSLDGVYLVFNGEIYNYREIRDELRNEDWQTESDTEVLLRSYLRWGPSCVERFEGMWSFAIYDTRSSRLLLSRDRFAEKPLYVHQTPKGLYFASETKFIRGLLGSALRVNRRHLRRYMVNGYKSLYKTRETFFEGVEELPPASRLDMSPDLAVTVERYWQPRHEPQDMSLDEAVSSFRARLLDSVRIRLRADVPIAFCLSGGLDSTSIVSIAAKVFGYDVATFSIIDQDERYNERENIEATLADLGCRHTVIETSTEGFVDRLRELVSYHDAPLYTISYYIHSFLSEAIAQQGYSVVCSGTGADEMVTGYYDHFNLYFYEMRNTPQFDRYIDEWRGGPGRFVRNPHLQDPGLYISDPGFRDHIYLNRELFASLMREDFDEPFTEEAYCEGLLQNRMMNEMFHEGTRVILHEDDLNSMKYSIENRSPYLDSRLFEFSYTIPTEYLIQKGLAKYVLREAVKGIVNDRVRLDPWKRGFNASLASLMDFGDRQTVDWLLEDSPVFDIVDRDRLCKHVPTGPMPNSMSKFWFYFVNTKVFLEQHTGGAS